MIAIIDYGMGNLHSVSKAVERLGCEVVVTADRETILAADGAILPGVGAFGDAMANLRATGLDAVVREYAGAGSTSEGDTVSVGEPESKGVARADTVGAIMAGAGAVGADATGSGSSWADVARAESSQAGAADKGTTSVEKYAGIGSGKPLLGICLGMQLLFTESEEHGNHRGLDLLPGRVVRFKGNNGLKVPHMGWNELLYRQPDSQLFRGAEAGHVYFVHSYHALPERSEDLLAVTEYGGPVTAIVGRGSLFGMQFHPEKSGDLGMKLLRNFVELTRG